MDVRMMNPPSLADSDQLDNPGQAALALDFSP